VYLDIVSLGIMKLRIIKFIGIDYTFISVGLPIVRNKINETLFILFKELTKHFNFHLVSFVPLSGLFNDYSNIKSLDNSYKVQVNKKEEQTIFHIENNFENQLNKISKQERRRMRKAYKEINDLKLELKSRIIGKDEFENEFDSFVNMHQEKWQNFLKPGHFKAWPHSYQFHKEFAKSQINNKRLKFMKIILNDQTIGYKYMFHFQNTLYAFLDAHTKILESKHIQFYRVGFGEQVKLAINEKIKWIDSMRGTYKHKMHLGGELYHMYNLCLYKNNIIFIKIFIFRKLTRFIHILYYKIIRNKAFPKIKIKPKTLWDLWIRTYMISK
ncbi:MAG: GNAT family N-acetyltransferase, partial [Spirochaetes bacterium]|nr:GNAT family N-acetyltransferase [Spirochaetota bacterium]